MATSGATTADQAKATSATPAGTGGWFAALKRAVADYKADNAGDLAAALTYYGVLSIFPALIALLSILGLVGQDNSKTLVDSITKLTPGGAQTIFTNAVNGLQKRHGSRDRVRDRDRGGAVVGVGLRQRVHAGLQCDLRRGGGPAVLEDLPLGSASPW